MQDSGNDHERLPQPESSATSDNGQDFQDAKEPKVMEEKGAAAPPADPGFPEGGTAAWLVVLGAWCCSFTSPGWINSIGTFQEYYQVGPLHNYSPSTIAWIPSLQIFFLFGLGPIVGRIFDQYGPRPLIFFGTLLHVFGLMMASLAKTYYQFLLSQGVCSAIGAACLYSPAFACVQTWFLKKRGAALGIMATGSSVGGVVFPIMISRMIRETGYPWAMRTAAFLILGLQVIACLTVRPRVKPVPKKMPPGRYSAPFTEAAFAILLLGIFVLTYGMYIPIDYLPTLGLEEAHMSEALSQYLVAILNAGSLFGRLVAGYGADWMGKWNMFIIACTVSGIANLALWIPAKTSSIVIGFAIMFGFASGAFVSLVGALPASVSPLPEMGYRMGVVFLVISIPALTMAPIGGAILDDGSNGFLGVKLFAGIMCLAGSAIIAVSRLLYTDKKLMAKF